jgi:hypothetical protein
MDRSPWSFFIIALLGSWLIVATGSAQSDLAKLLVGKWEGDVQFQGSAGSAQSNPSRTLIIESVDQKDGRWAAKGRYGMTGRGMARADIEVEESGTRPAVRFVTGAGSTVRLSLVDPSH